MAKTSEQKKVFNSPEGAKIIKANLKISDDGQSVEVIITTEAVQEQQPAVMNTENFDEVFPIIDPSEFVGHKLLKHKPKPGWQERLLADICKGIELKLPAFRAPFMDPSEEDGEIVFKPGNKPAVGHSPVWWDETWKKFMPSKNSRSGTELHWAAFLGKQIRCLVDEENYSVEDAWEAVCDDSRYLGHTCKILKKWEAPSFLLAGGGYVRYSYDCPLAVLSTINIPNNNHDYYRSVGWLVLDV